MHAMPNQTIFDFLSQQQSNLCRLISDIMDYFWAGDDQPQTTGNQPNDQASGVNPNL